MIDDESGQSDDAADDWNSLWPHLVGGGVVPDGDPRLKALDALGVVVRDPIRGWAVAGDLNEVVAESVRRTGTLVGLLSTAADLNSGDAGARVIATNEEATTLIAGATKRAKNLIWTAHPTDRRAEVLKRSLDRDVETLKKGVRYRTIYCDTARTRPGEVAWATAASAHGAEVRTATPPFTKCVFVDDDFAVIQDPEDDVNAPEYMHRGGILVTNPLIIKTLKRSYERDWDLARRWMDEALHALSDDFPNDRQLSIITWLIDGVQPATIAKRLNISQRTYDNERSTIFSAMGVKSHAGLGYYWNNLERNREAGAT
ncbi:LuxR C-terminal-related transcriptional regulator [Streptomyces sp. NPDC001941]|uniref:LuxR C-terminal-related transcriptional regulator n=1 Tax=Streptomyces sp. NPDC001941 TaxID=3154659 RepID=UPI00331D18AE